MLKRHFSVKSIGIKKQKELFFFCFFYFPRLPILIDLTIHYSSLPTYFFSFNYILHTNETPYIREKRPLINAK